METVSLAKLKLVKLLSPAVAVSWFLVAVPSADAQESGSFTMLYSDERNYTVIEHVGGQVTGGSLAGTSTVLESSGPPFAKGSVSAAACIVFVRKTEARHRSRGALHDHRRRWRQLVHGVATDGRGHTGWRRRPRPRRDRRRHGPVRRYQRQLFLRHDLPAQRPQRHVSRVRLEQIDRLPAC